jgi:protein tyrosine/serine phosphatase
VSAEVMFCVALYETFHGAPPSAVKQQQQTTTNNNNNNNNNNKVATMFRGLVSTLVHTYGILEKTFKIILN